MSQEFSAYNSKEKSQQRGETKHMSERPEGRLPKKIIEKKDPKSKEQDAGELHTNRVTAVTRLTQFLETPEEQKLFAKAARSHQGDVISGTRDYFASGETAGTIKLPTGAGKTIVAAAIIKALDMNTVFVSPTGTILDQTKKTIERISPDSRVTNYDGRSKSLAGNVINTTPNSLEELAKIDAIAQGTQLLVIDENHFGALGEQRHALWRKFPNALIIGLTATDDFPRLDELIDRGLVDPDERWVAAFQKRIAEMSPEEAMRRGAITPLDINLIKTTSIVPDVHVTRGGNYDEQQLERALNTAARNYAAIGVIAGLDTLPKEVILPDELRKELQHEHDLIKGKQMVAFGLSIKHIEWLAGELQERGIAAAEVHGKLSEKEKNRRLEAHRNRELQVVVAKDLLSLGFDSPATEVGLFLGASRSPNRLMQEVGRLMRLSEETGKTRARAIQFVDTYSERTQRPLLIPELFDPEAIEDQRPAEEKTRRDAPLRGAAIRREEPVITLEGVRFDAFIEEVATERGLAERFDHATLPELDKLFDELMTHVNADSEGLSIYEKYQKVVNKLPRRIGYNAYHKAREGISSDDPATVKQGERALLLLSMPHILDAVEPYLSDNGPENDEIVQAAILSVYHAVATLTEYTLRKQVQKIVTDGEAITGLAEAYGMPPYVVKRRKHVSLAEEASNFREQYPHGLDEDRLNAVVQPVAESLGIGPKVVKEYFANQQTDLIEEPQDALDMLLPELLKEDLATALSSLSAREADIISQKYGLVDGRAHTMDEIAIDYGVSRERIRQIQMKALHKLRHEHSAKKLRPYFE